MLWSCQVLLCVLLVVVWNVVCDVLVFFSVSADVERSEKDLYEVYYFCLVFVLCWSASTCVVWYWCWEQVCIVVWDRWAQEVFNVSDVDPNVLDRFLYLWRGELYRCTMQFTKVSAYYSVLHVVCFTVLIVWVFLSVHMWCFLCVWVGLLLHRPYMFFHRVSMYRLETMIYLYLLV